ncbi:hypothetical protein COCMIDRAFT_102998, partial [Bipolaris oryzae ATCC 44560]
LLASAIVRILPVPFLRFRHEHLISFFWAACFPTIAVTDFLLSITLNPIQGPVKMQLLLSEPSLLLCLACFLSSFFPCRFLFFFSIKCSSPPLPCVLLISKSWIGVMSALTMCIMSTSCRCSCSAGASRFAFSGLAFSSAGFAFVTVVYLPATGFTPAVPLCMPFDEQDADLMMDFLPVEQLRLG